MGKAVERRWIPVLWIATAVLVVLAVVARGIQVEPPPPPEDRPVDEPRIEAPMQFLAGGAGERVAELDRWVSDTWRADWRKGRAVAFGLQECPRTLEWLQETDGLAIERLVDRLRTGSREDALAALCLVLEIARSTDWDPGFRGRAEHAEKLGALLRPWLRVWGDRGADDPILHEPTLAACLVYGAVMRVAWRAPVVGYNEAAYTRATDFLDGLLGLGGPPRTPLGAALEVRYGRAWAILEGEEDRLRGLTEDAALLFPAVEGDCE